MEFGKRIKIERAKNGWTQADLAKKAGTHRATIQRLERIPNYTESVGAAVLDRICLALNIKPDDERENELMKQYREKYIEMLEKEVAALKNRLKKYEGEPDPF